MANLLEEAKELLKECGKSLEDILYCQNDDGWFELALFKELANREYYEDHGAVEAMQDLVLIGNDFWLERFEYDGAECWKYQTKPKKTKTKAKDVQLFDEEAVARNREYFGRWEKKE